MKLQGTIIAALLALAALQIGVALRGALRDPPVPLLFTRPTLATHAEARAASPSSAAPAIEPAAEVARPDPANILRLSIDAHLSPAKMQADANIRLELLIENRRQSPARVVVRNAEGTVIERSAPVVNGEPEAVFVTLPHGRYDVRIEGAAEGAELRIE